MRAIRMLRRITLVTLFGLTAAVAGHAYVAPATSVPGAGNAAVPAASVVGSAWNADNSPIPQARLRLRNVKTGRIEAGATANELGQFTFRVEGGTYLIELVSEAGKLLAVGHTFSIAPGETVATFVRLAAKVPWFSGFFANAAAAAAATAASTGVTAIAPEEIRSVTNGK